MGDTHNTQKKTYIMALDQGTTSSRCILFDKQGNICSMAQKEFTQIYPQPGWVEHNPMEIWSSQLGVAIESMAVLGITDDRGTGIQCHCMAVPPDLRYDRGIEKRRF